MTSGRQSSSVALAMSTASDPLEAEKETPSVAPQPERRRLHLPCPTRDEKKRQRGTAGGQFELPGHDFPVIPQSIFLVFPGVSGIVTSGAGSSGTTKMGNTRESERQDRSSKIGTNERKRNLLLSAWPSDTQLDREANAYRKGEEILLCNRIVAAAAL